MILGLRELTRYKEWPINGSLTVEEFAVLFRQIGIEVTGARILRQKPTQRRIVF